jgi:hypothetical protein
MTHLLLLENRHTPFPPRAGRTSVKHHLCHRANSPVGIVQCGNEFLMSSKILPLMPFHMANEQVQGVAVSHGSEIFR